MATQTYQLVLRSGPHPGRVFELAQDVVSIGRDVANTIVINDAEVSRRHARLTAQAGGYILEDLGSTNGTFVNGTRLLGPHLIRAGETITLAENIALEVQVLHMDPDATVAVVSGPVTAPAAEKQAPYPPESYQTSVPTQKPAYAAPMPPPVQPVPHVPGDGARDRASTGPVAGAGAAARCSAPPPASRRARWRGARRSARARWRGSAR